MPQTDGRSLEQIAEEIEERLAGITPGEWEVAPHSDTDEVLNVVAGYEKVSGGCRAHWIAECDACLDFDSDREGELDRNEANAKFIAAAPRLLREVLSALQEARGREIQKEQDHSLLGSTGGGFTGDWKPIETAPTDVAPILCAHPEHGIEIRYGCAARYENGGEYQSPEKGCAPYWYFTHWMPLPAPPTLQAQGSSSDFRPAEPGKDENEHTPEVEARGRQPERRLSMDDIAHGFREQTD